MFPYKKRKPTDIKNKVNTSVLPVCAAKKYGGNRGNNKGSSLDILLNDTGKIFNISYQINAVKKSLPN